MFLATSWVNRQAQIQNGVQISFKMKIMLPLPLILPFLAKHTIPIAIATAIQRTVKLIPVKIHLLSATFSFDEINCSAPLLLFSLNSVKEKKVTL